MLRPNNKLPGIQFVVKSPSLGTLPRMDVAVFVGFAASGPVDVPVAIETPARFAEIFGPDLQLAWLASRGEWQMAHLGPAVRAFFQNGGRRCWIIRVAGASAVPNSFELRGLVRWTPAGSTAAKLIARSKGSWSDLLQVAATLQLLALPVSRKHVACWLWHSHPLQLQANAASALQAGDVVRLTLREPASLTLSIEGYLAVAELLPPLAKSTHDVAAVLRQAVPAVWFQVEVQPDGSTQRTPRTAPTPAELTEGTTLQLERLNIELWAKDAASMPVRLRDLGLHPLHPRFWRALPDDRLAFSGVDPLDHYATFRASVLDPRFPLAGTAWSSLHSELYLPLGLGATPDYVAAEPLRTTRPVRDGMLTFEPKLFLDERLADLFANELLSAAESLFSAGAPSVRGLHAAWVLDEATLISVPDALHRSWFASTAPRDVGIVVDAVAFAVSAPMPAAAGCDCQAPAALPRCEDVRRGPGAFEERPIGPSAPVLNHVSPASSPALLSTAADSVGLAWTDQSSPPAGAVRNYELEESSRPDWSDAIVRYNGPEHNLVLYNVLPGVRRFRVRAIEDGLAGPWSNTREVQIAAPQLLVVDESQASFEALLRVQRALIRLCTARGDMVATLALPDGMREQAALDHVARLRAYRDPSDSAALPDSCLSYAVIVHPWLVVLDATRGREPLSMPPDAACVGLMAALAVERGAWISPATRTFTKVVGLLPALAPDKWEALLEQGVNVIQQAPAGFSLLRADTLSSDIDLQPLNVRRLLTLLRRVALDRGSAYVFEPHDATLRREVEATFNTLLADLFSRGAFAGDEAQSAYRVLVDVSSTADDTRFVVQLQVAPAVPLTFIQVVLEQKAGSTQIREVA